MTEEPGVGGDDLSTVAGGAVALKEPPAPPRPVLFGARRRWYRRRLVVAAAIAVLAGGGVTLGLVLTGSSTPSYVPVTVGFGTVSQSVTASGTLQPVTSANVDFQVSGTVNSVAVSDGENVTAGQTLATVGTQSLELSLQEAEASLAGARAALSDDQGSGASSPTIESDDAQVASAESALAQAHDDLGEATLTAPISGTITTLDLAVGDGVTRPAGSGSGDGSSSTEVVIENLSQFEVSASVNAGSAGSVKVGEQAVITPSSSGAAPVVLGTVSSVSTVPTVTSGVASFPVVVTVTGSPGGLYSGTSANISIVTAQRNNVLVVPSAAVLNYGPDEYVEKLVHDREVLTRVTTGMAGGSLTQITSGLQNGEQIALRVAGPSGGPGSIGPAQGRIIGPGGAKFIGPGGSSVNISPGGRLNQQISNGP